MAGKIQEQLLEEFSGLFDGKASGLHAFETDDGESSQSLTETMTQLGQAVSGLAASADGSKSQRSDTTMNERASVTQSLSDTVSTLSQVQPPAALSEAGAAATSPGANTRGGTAASTNTDSSSSSVESIATTFLESGFGIVPLITGLIGLFSGGSDPAPALEKYAMPSSISFDSADTGDGLSAADFDQTGAPRVYSPAATTSAGDGSSNASSPSGAPSAGAGVASPQITVNVQAMDAQSFMDYSSQIAQAVRGAMLNLSSLNDVVNEL